MAAFPITSRRLTRNTETCLETYLIVPGIITAPFLKHIVFSQNILNIAAKIVILLLAFNCNLQADSLESLFFFFGMFYFVIQMVKHICMRLHLFVEQILFWKIGTVFSFLTSLHTWLLVSRCKGV